MSLFDWDDAQSLVHRARWKRETDPRWQPETDLYCSACMMPHVWCDCLRKAAA